MNRTHPVVVAIPCALESFDSITGLETSLNLMFHVGTNSAAKRATGIDLLAARCDFAEKESSHMRRNCCVESAMTEALF